MNARAPTLPDSFESDLSAFVDHAERYWSEIAAGSSKKANAEESANAKLVAKWKMSGLAVRSLQQLLQHPSPKVRFASAAHLVMLDSGSQAVSVLRDLSKNDDSLVGASAKAVLRINHLRDEA